MSVVTLLAEAEAHVALPFPAAVFGIIALVVFAALAIVVHSYRDVARRHSQKTSGAAPADHGHGH